MILIDDRDGQNAVVGSRLAAQIAQAESGRELGLAVSAQGRVPLRTEEGAASWFRPTPINLALSAVAGCPERNCYRQARNGGGPSPAPIRILC